MNLIHPNLNPRASTVLQEKTNKLHFSLKAWFSQRRHLKNKLGEFKALIVLKVTFCCLHLCVRLQPRCTAFGQNCKVRTCEKTLPCQQVVTTMPSFHYFIVFYSSSCPSSAEGHMTALIPKTQRAAVLSLTAPAAQIIYHLEPSPAVTLSKGLRASD